MYCPSLPLVKFLLKSILSPKAKITNETQINTFLQSTINKMKRQATVWEKIFANHISDWLPGSSVVKNLPANVGDTGDVSSIPGSGRSPGGGNGKPLQYSCLGNPMVRGVWWAAVHGVAESQTQLSN